MTVQQRPVTLAEVESALARNQPSDTVLDLADALIEQASDAGDGAALAALAALLEGAAETRDDARGLVIAARRASAGASALGVVRRTPSEAEVASVAVAAGTIPPPAADASEQDGPVGVRYSGWWRRVFAFLLDWVALTVAFMAVPTEASDAVWLLAALGLPLAYFAGFHAFNNGRTIGKALLGIAVRLDDGRPVDLPLGLARAFVQGLLWITVIGGIVDSLVPLGDGRRRAVHDRAAGTIVVRTR